MKDADLRRIYHRLCRKHGYDDSDRAFKVFKAGVEYARNTEYETESQPELSTFDRLMAAYRSQEIREA